MRNNKTNLSAADRRIYKYWQALFLAFFSSRLYIDVAKRWKGFGLAYFLMVMALITIPLGIKAIQQFNATYTNQMLNPINKMPDFAIRNGKLSFKYFMPYLINNGENETVVVIDDQLSLTQVNAAYPKWMIFISLDRLYIRKPQLNLDAIFMPKNDANQDAKEIGMLSFATIQDQLVDVQAWSDQFNLASIQRYVDVLIYPTLTMLLFGFLSSCMLLFSIFGRLFSYTFFKLKLSFKVSLRLMLVSSGSSLILYVISLSFGHIPGIGFYTLGLTGFYFFFAVMSLKREAKGLVLSF